MGEGPLYSFFIPYHLVHFEVPNAIARVVLFRDPVARALAGPVVEVCAVAKRDLEPRESLDDYGMYMTYGEAVGVEEMSSGRYLPEGLVEGLRPAPRHPEDEVLTYDDVELPPEGSRTACARSSTTLPRRDLAHGRRRPREDVGLTNRRRRSGREH